MTLVLPPELTGLAYLVAGCFPRGDEDAMRCLGDGWSDTADGLLEAAERSAAAAARNLEGMAGDTPTALAQSHHQVTDDLINQSTYCDSMARQCYEGANGIELYKLMAIGALAMLALQLAVDGALWWAGGGLKAAADTAATRAAVLTGFRELLGKLVWWGAKRTAERRGLPLAVKAGMISAAQEGVVNAGAQWYQIQQGNRDSVDMASLGVSVAGGAAGGAAAGELMRRYMSPVFDRFGAVVGTLMLGGAGGVVGGGAGLAVSVGLTGQIPTGDDLAEVLVSGIGGGVLGAAGTAARMSRAAAFSPTEGLPTPGFVAPGPHPAATRPDSAVAGPATSPPDTHASVPRTDLGSETSGTSTSTVDHAHHGGPDSSRGSTVPDADGDRSMSQTSNESATAEVADTGIAAPRVEDGPSRLRELVDHFAGPRVTEEVGALVDSVDHINRLRATTEGLESKIAKIEHGIQREHAQFDSWEAALESGARQDDTGAVADSIAAIRRDYAHIEQRDRAEQHEL